MLPKIKRSILDGFGLRECCNRFASFLDSDPISSIFDGSSIDKLDKQRAIALLRKHRYLCKRNSSEVFITADTDRNNIFESVFRDKYGLIFSKNDRTRITRNCFCNRQ